MKTMVKEFRKRLPRGYEQVAKKRGLSLREAVTFASLIEKETGIEAERSMISEVIWRRLERKMPLGIDAAIIYGIKDYTVTSKASTKPQEPLHLNSPRPSSDSDLQSFDEILKSGFHSIIQGYLLLCADTKFGGAAPLFKDTS